MKNRVKRSNILLLRLVLFVILFGFKIANAGSYGTLTGRILDKNNMEALIGANVLIEGSGRGAASDLDGSFFIYQIPQGAYTLRVSYIGYESKRINDIEIRQGDISTINIALAASGLELESVIVEVEASKTTDAYLISRQKRSSNIQDGISSDQISKNGDSNAAEAAQRISGVTIVDGKYIYVRGLGNRYTNTEMNGAPIPSPEPDKRTVPLNMFPSALLENITVLKTYTPDLPATFAGANVNIETKAYPDLLILKPSFSVSHNTYPQEGDTYYILKDARPSFWGYDGGKRALCLEQSPMMLLWMHTTGPWATMRMTAIICWEIWAENLKRAINSGQRPCKNPSL